MNYRKSYSINTRLDVKNSFAREKNKHMKISEMPSSFLLQFSSIFVSWSFSKKKLDACWFMSVKSSTVGCFSKCCCQRVSQLLRTILKQLWSSNFQNSTFEKLPYQWRKSFSSKCSFLPLVLDKNENTRYHRPWYLQTIQESGLLKTREFYFSSIISSCSDRAIFFFRQL